LNDYGNYFYCNLQIIGMFIVGLMFYYEYKKYGIITLEDVLLLCIFMLPIINTWAAISLCIEVILQNRDKVIYIYINERKNK